MSFGLFARLALSFTALLCCALLTLGYFLLRDAQIRFHEERVELAVILAETLADGSLDALVSRDYELLERWVSAVIPADYYAYAYLARVDGQVLTHTNLKQVGHHLDPIGEIAQPLQRDVIHNDRPVREVVSPARIGTQYLANAVVGFYTDPRPFYTNKAALQIVLVLGVFLSLLLGATLLIIRKHTQPLTELANTMTATSLGAAGVKRPDSSLLARSDEVGALAREYDSLVERLADAYSELQNEEQRLRRMVEERTEKLQQSNEELEAFSYSVSHDLRAPLRAINGFSEILEEEYADGLDAPGKDYLTRVRTASQNMGCLIDGLLNLSRVTRLDLARKPVDLSSCVKEKLTALREQYPQRNVEATITPGIIAEGDPTLLELVIDNLVSNAWKYTAKSNAAKIEFGVGSERGETVYFLRDNGAGFDTAFSDKLFAPFQRLHGSNEFEGSGVGLATVQRILKRHSGRIWADAKPDQGATFFFTVGAADQ